MEFTILQPVTMNVKYLRVEAHVRYWEDAEVNGIAEDNDDPKIPFRSNDCWCPLIDVDTGTIVDWPNGITAKVHYKVCDSGVYYLLSESKMLLASKEGYVPSMLSPIDNGYGDYIIMSIDGNGKIEGWKADLSYFNTEE